MNIFNNLGNFDFLLVIFTSIVILFLGFVTFLNNQKSITNKTFLVFTILATFYAVSNYLFYTFTGKNLIVLASRFVAFFVIWYSFFLFQFFYTFPRVTVVFSKRYKFILVPLVLITSLLCLSPFVFSDVIMPDEEGQIPIPKIGWGGSFFAITSIYLTFGSFYLLIKKIKRAKSEEFIQYLLVLIGTITTYSLYIIFSLIFTVVFSNTSFIPLAPVFIIPFVVLTFYSIVRYKFLNIKIIATEAITLTLVIITLFEVFLSNGIRETLYKTVVFILVTVLGGFLIKSVRREVEQREKLAVLSEQLKKANEELKKLDRAKSEFISIASHQLRTPMTIIKGFISMINEGSYGKVPKNFVDPLDKAYESNLRLLGLVEDLLSISRIESGKLKYNFQQLQLSDTVESVVEQFTDTAKKKGLKVIWGKPKIKLPSVTIDELKIRQIVINLIDNAIKYTPKGSVTITVLQEGDTIVFRCKDTGLGMDKDEIGGLFEKFRRSKRSTLENTGGSGLGLFVGRMMVSVHGGKIWAESKGHDKGSTFAFSLPIHPGQLPKEIEQGSEN